MQLATWFCLDIRTQSILGLLTACVGVCSCTSIVSITQKSPNHDDQSLQSGNEYVYHMLGIYYKSFNIVFLIG